jgi:copper chaperone CopZ
VSGNSTTAKVAYWPNEVDEATIRKALADAGFPVK